VLSSLAVVRSNPARVQGGSSRNSKFIVNTHLLCNNVSMSNAKFSNGIMSKKSCRNGKLLKHTFCRTYQLWAVPQNVDPIGLLFSSIPNLSTMKWAQFVPKRRAWTTTARRSHPNVRHVAIFTELKTV
jgi:hypothetical protein